VFRHLRQIFYSLMLLDQGGEDIFGEAPDESSEEEEDEDDY
jgi:hypothetical protein